MPGYFHCVQSQESVNKTVVGDRNACLSHLVHTALSLSIQDLMFLPTVQEM
jgi:hypothetical protein